MQPWSSPSKDKSKAKNKLLSPTPDDLRTLVFDYLAHNSFTRTARAFVRESAVEHLDADGDEMMSDLGTGSPDPLADALEEKLTLAEYRKEIRIHILAGRIDEAITLLNKYFPSVLSTDHAMAESTPEPEPSHKFRYIASTSIDPTHLALNLRIQAFIELARTIPLPYHPPGSVFSSPSPSPSPPPPSSAAKGKQPATSSDDSDMEPSVQQLSLILCAQNLYAEANRLPKPEDHALYLRELGHVSGLLAYPDPEHSPMAQYLTQERREAIADQIESAILFRLKQLPISSIELCTRYTSVMWQFMHTLAMKAPPQSRWPPGVQLPLSAVPISTTGNTDGASDAPSFGKKAGAEKDSGETIPAFSLTEFLDSKP